MGFKSESQARRNRTKYTLEQLNVLEKAFSLSQYPDTETTEELADHCNVSTEKISTWFQNRRSKFKRQSKDSNVSWMRQHIFNRPPEKEAEHVLSAPPKLDTNNSPRSNLHHSPDILAVYPVPPTPVYPPVIPHDMFNDITGDVNSKPFQQQGSTSQERIIIKQSSPSQQDFSPLFLEHSVPSPCSLGSPDPTFIHDSSSDNSLTTSPLQSRLHPAFPASQQQSAGFQNMYLNQFYQWQYFQTSVAMAHQCMYRH